MKEKGYVLLESMVAITMVTVGLLGIFALLSRSLSLNRVVADRYVAAYLAAEGLELVKNIIDNNLVQERPWNEGVTSGQYEIDFESGRLTACGSPCAARFFYFDPQTKTYSYESRPESRETRFERVVKIALTADGEEVRVNSAVNWTTRGGGRFLVNLEDHFFNWR